MNSRRTTIWFLLILMLLVLALTYVITAPFLKPLAFAIILAVVFYPVHRQMCRITRQRRNGAAALSTLLLLLVFGVPAFIITMVAANEALTAAHYLVRRSAEEGGFTSFVMTIADRPLRYIGRWVDISKFDLRAAIAADVQKASVAMVAFGAAVLGNLARFVTETLLTFVVVFFLFRDGKGWAERAGTLIPLAPEQVERLYRNISDTIIANVYGILVVGAAQGVLAGIGYRIVGLPSSLLLGVATGFASVIPVIGSALIWASAAIYLLVTGSAWQGVFLLVWGTVVVTVVDNVLRPWVVGGRVELHPLVLLFFIFGGVEAFGFLGLFLGPVVASVLVVVYAILREELASPDSALARPNIATGR